MDKDKYNKTIQIGVIGDYDGRPSHIATSEALIHSGNSLGVSVEVNWIPTDSLLLDIPQQLERYQGLWCAPGSPYKSMQGAINAIQYARENSKPFLGTCGGFQHGVLEYAKNVLGYEEIEQEGFDLYSLNLFITALSCSLVGQSRKIEIHNDSLFYNIYQCNEVEEKYNCSFGLNKEFEKALLKHDFSVEGRDTESEIRAIAIETKRFYVLTLFQPQLSSTVQNPHPLITAYLKSIL